MKKILCLFALLLLSVTSVIAQKKDDKKDLKESIDIKFKEGAKPMVFVDGKKFDFSIDLLDTNKIESVFVVKGKEALEKYNAPNGVVLVQTKKAKKMNKAFFKIREKDKIFSGNLKPIIIIDGKVSDQKTLDKLNKENIDKIDILKGKAAKEKYNAENGVILITTKKEK